MQTDNIKGKNILITGAARRLGKDIALSLADKGANIAVHFNTSRESAEDVYNQIKNKGVTGYLLQADLSDPESAGKIADTVMDGFGRIDYLINSASVFDENKLREINIDNIEKNININALSPLFLSRELINKSNTGSIINFLDTEIWQYDKVHAAYHLSKRLMFSLTRMMSLEFAPEVRVNAIAPGLILPPEGEGEEFLKKKSGLNPLNTYGSAAEICNAVLFLLESRFITGQIIYIDGGRHLYGNVYGS